MSGGRNAVRAPLRGAVSRVLRELGAARGIEVTDRPALELLEERILFGGGSTVLKGAPQVANVCPPPANAASDVPGATLGAGHNVQTNDNDMFTLKDLPQPPEPQPPSMVDLVRRAQMVSEVAPGSRTLFPVSAFDGMPIIQSTDLSSTPFGINWAIDRSWVGSDDSGPVGNGWAIAEAPNITVTEPTYSLSGDSNTLALPGDYLTISFGADATYDFAIPPYNVRTFNTFDSFTPTDGQPLQLVKTTDGSVTVLKMTDAAGNSTEFYDVPRDSHSRPIPVTYGTPSLYGRFYKSVTANGTTVTASYNGSDQLTGDLITNPASSASEQYVFSYTPTSGTGTVTNSMVTSAGGTVPQLVSEVDLQEKASGADSWHTQRSVTYTYYNGDGTDNAGNTVNTADGRLGDLEMATVHDSAGNVISQDYYRYYKLTGEQYDQQQQQINGQIYSNPSPTNVMSTTGGGTPLYQGWGDDGVQGHTIAANPYADDYVFSGLKTVVNGPEFDRLAAAVPGFRTAPDSGTGGIQPYVSNFFTYERWGDHVGMDGVAGNVSGIPSYGSAGYNGDQDVRWMEDYFSGTRYRATEEIAQGSGCSSCTQGQGTFKYEYATNYFDKFSTTSGTNGNPAGYNTLDYNVWRMKMTEYLPDDTPSDWSDNDREVIYTNEVGQPVLDVYAQAGGAAASVTAMSAAAPGSQTYSVVTVTANNSFTSGQYVALSGILPELYDGVFKVVSATSTSFTFDLSQNYFTNYSGFTVNPPPPRVNTTTPGHGPVTLGPGSATPIGKQWMTYYRYDDAGRLIETASPSAVTGYDDSFSDPVDSGFGPFGNLSANSGVVSINKFSGWNFQGRAGITAAASTIIKNGGSTAITLPTGDTEVGFIQDGSFISQDFVVGTSGTYTLNFKAANAFNSTLPIRLLVDGVAQTVTFNGSSVTTINLSTSAFQSGSVSLGLSAGLHTIRFIGYDPSGTSPIGTALVADVGFSGSGAPVLDDSNFGALGLASGTFQLRPQNYAITATTSTPGSVAGSLAATYVQQGRTGTPIQQAALAYVSHSGGGSTVYPLASETAYANADGTDPRTTLYSYTWQTGSTELASETITAPPITASQNGPASSTTDTANADTYTTVFDALGYPTWEKDGDGYIRYTKYDPLTGGIVKHIDDVNTADTTDFSNLPSGWTTRSGGGLELITVQILDLLGRPTSVTDPNLNVTRIVYNDGHSAGSGGFVDEVRVYPGWHSIGGGSYTTTGPVQVTREYRPAPGASSGQQAVYDETLTFTAPVEGFSDPSGTESISASNIQSLTRRLTNNAGQMVEQDDYASLSGLTYSAANAVIASAAAGTNNSAGNYSATIYAYDSWGRLNKIIDPNGTISRTIFDGLGRVTSQWVGTDDTPTSGYWSPANRAGTDLMDVQDKVYDSGGVGDSNLTQTTTHVDTSSAADRVSQFLYDFRDRLVAEKDGVSTSESDGAHRPITYSVLDNLGEVLRAYRFDGDGVSLSDFSTDAATDAVTTADASKVRALAINSFDDIGRVFRTQSFNIDQANGTNGLSDASILALPNLATSTYYDHRGNAVAVFQPGGQVSKSSYDGANRPVSSYVTDGGAVNNANVQWTDWTNATSLTNDVVLTQNDVTYDGAGDVVLDAFRQRFDNDSTASTRALGTPSTGVGARVYYTASYYDTANRLTDTVNVGTNGGTAYTRPGSVPSRSDSVLVTHTDYDNAGNVADTVDPRGIQNNFTYDLQGRKTQEDDGHSGPAASGESVTDYTYTAKGDVLTMTAEVPGSNNQTTSYSYRVTGTALTDLFSNDLVGKVEYPNKTTGSASTSASDDVSYTYDLAGQVLTKTDQNQTTHTYAYDLLGRPILDAVTTLGSGVDGSILALGYNYTALGLPYQQTSYSDSAATTAVNQVQNVYNGYGQLTTQYQEHSGAVDTGTSLNVQYGYSQPTGANYSRLASMTYPNGRVLDYVYNSGIDTNISRVSQLSDDSGTGAGSVEAYTYLGLDTIVQRSDGNGIVLTYIKQSGESNGAAGDQYNGLDAFGRVIDQRWIPISSATTPTDRFQYGYDRDGNVLYKNNLVNSAFSELYHANSSTSGDNNTAYDNLNRLTGFRRGTLSSSGHNGTGPDTVTTLNTNPNSSQSWTLDAVGNQTAVNTDGTNKSNTLNSQNELTGFGTSTLTFDSDGNTTTDDQGHTLVYDAWNKLVQVKNGSTTLAAYGYDANKNRTTQTGNGVTSQLYNSEIGQVIEERQSGTTTNQYVWSLAYINAPILRDDNSTGGSYGNSGSGLGRRLYAQEDTNSNITALTNTSGTVLQRFDYTPYGVSSVLDGTTNWGATTNFLSWVYTFEGGRYDPLTGMFHFGGREYIPTLARWIQKDPSGFVDGPNLYQALRGAPLTHRDPTGLTAEGEEEKDICDNTNDPWGLFPGLDFNPTTPPDYPNTDPYNLFPGLPDLGPTTPPDDATPDPWGLFPGLDFNPTTPPDNTITDPLDLFPPLPPPMPPLLPVTPTIPDPSTWGRDPSIVLPPTPPLNPVQQWFQNNFPNVGRGGYDLGNGWSITIMPWNNGLNPGIYGGIGFGNPIPPPPAYDSGPNGPHNDPFGRKLPSPGSFE